MAEQEKKQLLAKCFFSPKALCDHQNYSANGKVIFEATWKLFRL